MELLEAVKNNDSEKVKYLFDKGANDLNNALTSAADNGYLEIVKVFIRKRILCFK